MRRLIELSLLFLVLAAIAAAPPVDAADTGCESQESGIAGFRFYQGRALRPLLEAGETLHLLREPGNPYDAAAVAVYWGEFKLGYVESRGPCAVSVLLDAGVPVDARVAARTAQAGAIRVSLHPRQQLTQDSGATAAARALARR